MTKGTLGNCENCKEEIEYVSFVHEGKSFCCDCDTKLFMKIGKCAVRKAGPEQDLLAVSMVHQETQQ